MPLFYQHNINQDTELGVWKIEEDEDFFLHKVPLQREISHPHKRLQHLAGRYLLQYMFPDFPYSLIQIADTRKPFLSNESYHFSISHCGNYAAAIVSRQNRVGVDIELVKPSIEKIKQKFLSEEEIRLCESCELHLQESIDHEVKSRNTSTGVPEPPSTNLSLLTLLWSAKESMFKWFGDGAVDFRKHMQVRSIHVDSLKSEMKCRFTKGDARDMTVQFRQFDALVLAWVVTPGS